MIDSVKMVVAKQMRIQDEIVRARMNPDRYFREGIQVLRQENRLTDIERGIAVLMAGAMIGDLSHFEWLSRQIFSLETFVESDEYKYYFYIARGLHFRYLLKLTESLESFDSAMQLSYRIGNPSLIVKTMTYLASAYRVANDREMSQHYREQAVARMTGSEDDLTVGDAYIALGVGLIEQEKYQEAFDILQRARGFYARAGAEDHINYCILLLNAGEAAQKCRRHQEAEMLFLQGLAMTERFGFKNYVGVLNNHLAQNYAAMGRFEDAYNCVKSYGQYFLELDLIKARMEKSYDKKALKHEIFALNKTKRQSIQLKKQVKTLRARTEQREEEVQGQKPLFEAIERAIAEKEIVAYFQGKWSVSRQCMVGAEALARWIRKDGTLVPPNSFIGMIEESDLIGDFSQCITDQAFAFCRRVVTRGYPDFVVSINISPYQLKFHDVARQIERAIVRHDLRPENVEVEVTERSFMDHRVQVIENIRNLKKLGVKLSMDDFGAGYSSLADISQYPFDLIKIDRSLIRHAAENKKSANMLEGILKMMRSLEMEVVVEGVETQEQLEFLKTLECEYIQGYLFSRPVCEQDYLERHL